MDPTRVTSRTTGPGVVPPLLDNEDAALFPKLTDTQVDMLSRHGEVRSVEAATCCGAEGTRTTR
jgi:hypothetical protein